jgi:guanine deaminase
MNRVLRAEIFHTPADPFVNAGALEHLRDGAVAFDLAGRILQTGPYAEVRRAYPDAEVLGGDRAIALPGLIDTHVHYPQLSVIGAMGMELLQWLARRTLPEEARLADPVLARSRARRFLGRLAANGTTSALVFGTHFPAAQRIFFEEAQRSGLRITSGLVVSDCNLCEDLHCTPRQAHEHAAELIDSFHGQGRLRYAVTPRFALSCTQAMLESCAETLNCAEGLTFTTHLNENLEEVRAVLRGHPGAHDYLDTYERCSLLGPRSVFAHDIHVGDGELARLGQAGASVAHCPSSNQFLGSGLFPLARHLRHGVCVGLGSDVGAGTSLSLLSECLFAYLHQMLAPDGRRLDPAELLYLATGAGARALGLGECVGDLRPGKSADLVLLRAPAGSTLEAVLDELEEPEARLGAIITLAREESVERVFVAGAEVFAASADGVGAPAD